MNKTLYFNNNLGKYNYAVVIIYDKMHQAPRSRCATVFSPTQTEYGRQQAILNILCVSKIYICINWQCIFLKLHVWYTENAQSTPEYLIMKV